MALNDTKLHCSGRSTSKHERFRCRLCKRIFLLSYTCEARKPSVQEQIAENRY